MSNSAPKIVALAGPNGAGKTTFAVRLLPGRYGQIRFLNADLMAQELSPPDPESVALEAGRAMLDEMREMVDGWVTFAFETTLASRSLASHVARARLLGYEFHLYFISLASVELAVARVEERARGRPPDTGGRHPKALREGNPQFFSTVSAVGREVVCVG